MQSYTYQTQGVCPQVITFNMEDGVLHDVHFHGGCPGNTVAISKLIEGAKAQDIANILKGNQCGARGTSCADQLALAIEQALVNQNIVSNN